MVVLYYKKAGTDPYLVGLEIKCVYLQTLVFLSGKEKV